MNNRLGQNLTIILTLISWSITCISGLLSDIRSLHSHLLTKKSNHITSVINLPCITSINYDGKFKYQSHGQSHGLCGTYIIAPYNKLIRIEFTHFNIQCRRGVSIIVDGWEIKDELFPGGWDRPYGTQEIYQSMCGNKPPVDVFISSQNVALIKFFIPIPGQGFSITVSFESTDQPCNVVSLLGDGVFTLRNFGLKKNCTMSILHPESMELLSLDVGITMEAPVASHQTSVLNHCSKYLYDYVELLNGDGMDPSYMFREADVCGMSSLPFYSIPMACQHSVLRLVSSGHYFNSVTLRHRKLTPSEIKQLGEIECY